jgi:hypothetical protein
MVAVSVSISGPDGETRSEYIACLATDLRFLLPLRDRLSQVCNPIQWACADLFFGCRTAVGLKAC